MLFRVMSFTVTEESHEEIVDEMVARQTGEKPKDKPNLGKSLEEPPKVEPSRARKIGDKMTGRKEKEDASPGTGTS